MHLTNSPRRILSSASLLVGALALGALAFGLPSAVRADEPKPTAPKPAEAKPASPKPAEAKAAPAAVAPKEFASKEDAAKALIEAVEKNDDAALTAIAGGGAADVVQDGRDPQVHKDRAAFAAAAKKKLTYEEKDGQVTLVVGDEEWPFPIPLVKSGEMWHFDAEEGRQELLARRIGRNELRAIKICREFVEAQVEYASKDRDGDKVREYAQRLLSTPGTQDGLWWALKEGGEASPLGTELAPFKDYVPTAGSPAPFMGYYWRILVSQGENAPGGMHCYLVNGNMIAGFALIGVPAEYRNTGVMTLMVSNHGTIYQKDLGPKSLEIARSTVMFDPDPTWTAVPAEDLSAATE